MATLLAALAATACASELADGNPGNSTEVPVFGGDTNGPGTVNGVPTEMLPGVPGQNGDSGEGPPPVGQVVNSQADRNPSISGTGDTGPLVDAQGNPLPVDQLPPLRDCSTPGPQIIRRLTSQQYANTLRAVFERDDVPSSSSLSDASTLGYNVDADDSLIVGLDAQSLMNLGEEIATWAQGNGVIGELAQGCTDLNNPGCREGFVQRLGERISREPLDQERVQRFTALFDANEDGVDLVESFNDGAAMVITAMVQSPYMLYRRELGQQEGGEFQLTPFEVASELAYMLTDAPPDEQLMAAASNGQLSSLDQIEAQVDRLLDTAAAAEVLSRFVKQWLDVDGLADKVKAGEDLPDDVRDAMLRETEELFLEVLYGEASIGELFSATYTFLNQPLSDFYGIAGVTTPDFQRVDISDGQRAPGVLGHGSFLAEHALADNSSPVQRAFIVRERLLCNDLPEVPTDLDTNLKPADPNGTSRQRYTEHSSNEVCYTCHQLMDPIGFSFENYDGFGRFRDTEAGQPVDPTGSLPLMDQNGLTGVNVPLANVNDLANHLSQSEQARACLVNNLSYYAYGIANENKWATSQAAVAAGTPDKVCTDHYIRQVARDSGNTLRSVLSGIVSAPHFTRRVQSK